MSIDSGGPNFLLNKEAHRNNGEETTGYGNSDEWQSVLQILAFFFKGCWIFGRGYCPAKDFLHGSMAGGFEGIIEFFHFLPEFQHYTWKWFL